MLSTQAKEEIDRQITKLVKDLEFAANYRRPQIINKINELRALSEAPVQEIDYDALADAIVRKLTPQPKEPETFGDFLSVLLGGSR